MFFDRNSILVFFITFIIAYALFYIEKWRQFYKKYPPGPLGFPILGHLPLLGKKPWETFGKWKKNYGPIFSIRMGSFPAVVLSDPKIIRDAFNLHEFSGRASQLPALKVLGQKEQRNFSMRCLKNFQITKLLEEKTLFEMDEVLKKFQKVSQNWKNPVAVADQFNVPTMNALWSLFMGQRFDLDDPQLLKLTQLLHDCTSLDGILKPLFYFVSFLTKLFPRADCTQKSVEAVFITRSMVNEEFKKHLLLERSGTPANFMEAFQHEMQLHQNDPKSSFYEPPIIWYILLMTLHPEVQDRLHGEIQTIIGDSRPPSLNDRHLCHFAEAVINEVLRFSCLVPMAVFHRTLEDVPDFHGFRIPANTLIIPDMAGINLDPELWKHPEQFDPSRFIGVDGKFQKSDNLLPFSIGKRNCIGETIARKQLFLYVAGISQRFQLSYPAGKKPSAERVLGIVLRPHKFQVVFKERC